MLGTWHFAAEAGKERAPLGSHQLSQEVLAVIRKMKAAPPGTEWLWAFPPAADPNHARWHGRDINEMLCDFSGQIAQAIGARAEQVLPTRVATLDLLNPTLPTANPRLVWESGEEWEPRQHGGIHMVDHGRRLQLQLLLNAIRVLRA